MSASVSFKPVLRDQTMTPPVDNSRAVAIAEMPQVDQRFVRNKALPALEGDSYIPDDIMQALSQLPQPKDNLAPLKHKGLPTTVGPAQKPPANVWSHKRREKFKHLTDTTICHCGAGSDISFLYDVPLPKRPSIPAEKNDPSVVRQEGGSPTHEIKLPKTLIPEEYHLVKNKGVMGLEYYDDEYTMYTKNHEDHLVVFPSMKPSSRYEVMKLKQSMKQMLDKVGVNDDSVEVKGPTQIHNLLELIKKEQNIFNVVFHEIVRQCSVDCAERGELLNNLRLKYNALLSKVPKQIKGLHDEVLAQRALDRRLTEELLRFKSTISLLTDELVVIKAHDCKVTLEAEQAQKELKEALQEAARNASLLQEYHSLYELQRTRLENSVDVLTNEKEMWCAAAYSLAIKVTEESHLGSARKLHVVEKSWTKLANHFTILLSDQDTEIIAEIHGFIDKFRNKVADFNLALLHREDKMREMIDVILKGIQDWIDNYRKNCFNEAGNLVAFPSIERQTEMLKELHVWQECLRNCGDLDHKTLQELAEKFIGDETCTSEEELVQIRHFMDQWTENAQKLFNRHRKEDSDDNASHETMLAINRDVVELCSQYLIRLTGENGVAKGVILMMNMFETWDTKLNLSTTANNPIPDNHWIALQQMLEEWQTDIRHIAACIGNGLKENCEQNASPCPKLDAHEIVRQVQKWATTSMTTIDSENAKLVEQVGSLHNEMVYWMIQMLLRLAPNYEGNSEEINNVALLASDSVANLEKKAQKLFERLTIFSKYVSLCCDGIVRENVQQRQKRMDDSPDLELKDLRRLRTECAEWVHTAKMLLCRLTGGAEPDAVSIFSSDMLFSDPNLPVAPEAQPKVEVLEAHENGDVTDGGVRSDQGAGNQIADSAAGSENEEQKFKTMPEDSTIKIKDIDKPDRVPSKSTTQLTGERVEFIGTDENTHSQPVELAMPEDLEDESASKLVSKERPLTPNTKKAFEALAAMSNLQEKLVEAERRAFEAEERASVAEAMIVKQQEEIRALNKVQESTSEVNSAPTLSTLQLIPSRLQSSDTFVTQRDPEEQHQQQREQHQQQSEQHQQQQEPQKDTDNVSIATNLSTQTKSSQSKKKSHKK